MSRREGGDHGVLPEDFTLRAVLGGIAVGTLLMWSNLYFGLLSAWITMASLQAALVGYAIFRFVPGISTTGDEARGWKPFSSQENAVLQATAVSLGAMPLSAGLIGIVPAFKLLKPSKDGEDVHPFTLSWSALLLWCTAMAFFGIFFATPLRAPIILQEKLRFPSGSATAQLIALLHGTKIRDDDDKPLDQNHSIDREATRATNIESRPLLNRSASRIQEEADVEQGWRSLVISFVASSGLTIASFCFPVIYAVPMFDLLLPAHNAASRWGWWFTPSLSYIGQGIIMGPHTTISMFFGTIVGWAILSPLADHMGWTKGSPMDAEEGSKAWILWVSLAIMTSESIVGLITLMSSQYTSSDVLQDEQDGQNTHENVVTRSSSSLAGQYDPPWHLTPNSWIISGFIASTIASTFLLSKIFNQSEDSVTHISLWVPVVGILISAALSVLAVRALGATDLNPVNALGKLSQLAFAFLSPGNIVANMIGGALSEAGAMQSCELMQDFKTGHLVQASPRGQFLGQMVGSTVGIFASTFAYKLYERSYEIPGPDMPAPAARLWLNFARLINQGSLPRHSSTAMAISAAVFSLITFLKTYIETHPNSRLFRYKKWLILLPNGIAFAVGLGLNTPNFSIARLIGGIVVILANRKSPPSQRRKSSSLPPVKLLVLSAGFVLGEGFSSILILLFRELGFSAISCFGCRGGCSASCST